MTRGMFQGSHLEVDNSTNGPHGSSGHFDQASTEPTGAWHRRLTKLSTCTVATRQRCGALLQRLAADDNTDCEAFRKVVKEPVLFEQEP